MDATLETGRLLLRPYKDDDIAELVPLIGAREVAAMTLRIPHPFSEQNGREFLARIKSDDEVRKAVILRSDRRLIGGVGLRLDLKHHNAELGYWIGVPYWGNGYATEASSELVRYGFEELKLNRIYASHFHQNPILRKLGMRYEGCQRQHYLKWEQFVDSELYGLLREEWRAGQARHEPKADK
jgi:[ribosomal protein S5]-alanine N-acetyltransferase